MNTFLHRPALRFAAAVLCLSPAIACSDPAAATVQELLTRALTAAADQEVRMLTVEYAPGGSSAPHRHDAQVFVYVLSGSLRMQVAGAAPVTLKAGDTFYEAPGDVHSVSENASKREPAKFLVVMIKSVGAPVSRPATEVHP